MPIATVDKIWMDGELVAWDDAKIHVLTHTLHYGCGVFEGIRAYETDRGARPSSGSPTTSSGCSTRRKIFMIDIPFTRRRAGRGDQRDRRGSTTLPSCYIRPIVYLGYGEMGLNPLPCPVNVSIAVWPWGTYLGDEGVKNGVRMKISLVAAPRPQHHAARRQGHRHVHQLVAWPRSRRSRPATTRPSCCRPRATSASAPARTSSSSRTARSSRRPMSAGALEGITQDSVRTHRPRPRHRVPGREPAAQRPLHRRRGASSRAPRPRSCPSARSTTASSASPARSPAQIQETYFAAVRGEVDRYKDWLDHVHE